MRLPNALCSPCRRNVLSLSRPTSLLRNVHHVSIRHSSLSAIHRGLRDSEKSRPQGFKPTALHTKDSSYGRKPDRTTSRSKGGASFEKPTYQIFKGKKNITDKGPEPKSRRARFNDPEDSFGKKSLVYKIKNGPLREKLAALGETDQSRPSAPQRSASRSDSNFDRFESSFNNKTGNRTDKATSKKFDDRRGSRDFDNRRSGSSFGRDSRGSDTRSPNFSSERGGRSGFKGRSLDSSSERGGRGFDQSTDFSSGRRNDVFKERLFDSGRGRGGRDFEPRRSSPSNVQTGERKPWDGQDRRPRDFGRGGEQQFSNGYERRMADREARFTSSEDLPVRVHHTTAASQFLYGRSVVEAALKGSGRKAYVLYIYGGEDRQNLSQDIHLEKLAMAKGIRVQKIRDKDGLRSMDKMAGGRPHNGCVLEASPLPQLPLKALGPFSEDPDKPGFSVELAHQSAEDAAINGSPDFIPYRGPRGRKPFILLLDGILDPGNLGAILRTAGFLGVTGVAITKHSSASLTPVALKASAGASEVTSLYSVDSTLGFIECSKEAGWMIYASVAAGPRSRGNSHLTLDRLESYDPLSSQPAILVVGSEGEGLGKQIRRAADFEVSIPGAAGLLSTVDSLNVSVATGILCSSFLKKSQGFEIEEETVDLETDDKLW
ncbi:hypothetical protein PG993_005176 [Apiospora rasikravindrae]|uniref:rRNA methyltransferase 1, mitochondrial n=1 Tax=Apiospora rasikravindrae TaxID=990691 RepID=A0ABR1TEW1_9PEZI